MMRSARMSVSASLKIMTTGPLIVMTILLLALLSPLLCACNRLDQRLREWFGLPLLAVLATPCLVGVLVVLAACARAVSNSKAYAALMHAVRIRWAFVPCPGRATLPSLMKATKLFVSAAIKIVTMFIFVWETALDLIVVLRLLPDRPNRGRR